MSEKIIRIKSGNEEFTMNVTEEEYQKYYRPWWRMKKKEQRNREVMERNGYTEESYEGWKDPKYSVSAIIPKSDTETIEKIKRAIEQAKKDSVSKWGGKVPANLKLPLRDGDIDRPEDEAYADSYFFNANSKQAPQVVDKNVQPMTVEGLKNLIYLIHSKQYLIGRAFAEEVFRIPAALVEELGGAEVSSTEAFLQAFQSHAEGCRGISFPDGNAAFTLPAINDPGNGAAFCL